MPAELGAVPESDASPSELCTLQHRIFRSLTNVMFRRDESGETPVMVMSLGERIAAVPLRALQHELGIASDSPDGRMMALIAQSLGFVTGLQIGDPLPTEVLDGRASWTPGAAHRAIAAARLRLQLVAWLRPESVAAMPSDGGSVCLLDEDPATRQQVNVALEQAAHDLGVADRSAVIDLLEALAEELAYIEALREGLLNRVRDTAGRVERIWRAGRVDQKQQEMITQVRRLSGAALPQIAERFNEIDKQSREVVSALRNIEGQRSLVRSGRDVLYRLSRAWEPILQAWEKSGRLSESALWQLIDRTYRFLAPRYMLVQEWQAFVAGQHLARPKPMGSIMRW